MGTVHPAIDERLATFVEQQPVFFVATAPLAADGHVNVSPKGGRGTLVVAGPHTVAYLDLTASGAETIAHLRENGRITLMVCAFEGRPNIVRLHGTGRVVALGDPELDAWLPRFPEHPGVRAVIVVDVHRVSDSCGFAVPRMDYVGERDILDKANTHKGEEGLLAYRDLKNRRSLDGLPAVDW
ncbi:pyridoxamine 5'-phosphate oxidase family protein [Actinotalea ferrariae]|uniref:pyridoxamine 5'-phosphate oxidase family protein n=1 Tax=Actinotalea ferrariae TaxID=1386098 RepID=UPI001C8CE20E|nr:pyridoxamine 5'-phosphate oxidase family protein [Actinotalea ferrariae]MBX9245665.1 pyridoxamine 5'-phosphate oxidase family protein [Actinotalea ferrariae]